MPIKYQYNYSKPIEGSRWKHMVAISFTPKRRMRAISRITAAARQPYLSEQQEFLEFMNENYGSQEGRWSVRWSDYGVDVRFASEKDAGSFILFFTENSPIKNDIGNGRPYSENWWV